MRWLEVRRHSQTTKGLARGRGSALSPEGVRLARLVGAELGSFSYVVTSRSARAIETAIAMGYAGLGPRCAQAIRPRSPEKF